MPFEPGISLEEQVRQSVASSLRNLRPSEHLESESEAYIDCLLLHSPVDNVQRTLDVWAVMETYVPRRIRALGICNVNLPILKVLYAKSAVEPSIVQNRLVLASKYDSDLRQYCAERQIMYQGFWVLTHNAALLSSDPVRELATETKVTIEAAMYGLFMSLGIAILNGTRSRETMREDLRAISVIKQWKVENSSCWSVIVNNFLTLVSG